MFSCVTAMFSLPIIIYDVNLIKRMTMRYRVRDMFVYKIPYRRAPRLAYRLHRPLGRVRRASKGILHTIRPSARASKGILHAIIRTETPAHAFDSNLLFQRSNPFMSTNYILRKCIFLTKLNCFK